MAPDWSAKFWRNATPEALSGCWLWHGSVDKYGYPKANGRGGHRVAWEISHGPIERGMCVCHSCDVPSCVNPSHLFLGTHRDNMADKVRKGRECRGEAMSRTQSRSYKASVVLELRRAVASGETTKSAAARLRISYHRAKKMACGATWAAGPWP